MQWVFEERDRGHVICSSGAGNKNQFNQSKDRQTTRCRLWTEEETVMQLVSGCHWAWVERVQKKT